MNFSVNLFVPDMVLLTNDVIKVQCYRSSKEFFKKKDKARENKTKDRKICPAVDNPYCLNATISSIGAFIIASLVEI